ncbi:MAG: DNA repair protein RecN [SAR324 cluster bacterium]|nr:DNA repair protein RecN [SAR324 cluster bacterium]
MLLCLRITNLATIQHIELELEKGFSILTGETGAGKSIIIDAIHLISGKKADYSLIRSGEPQASVEAVFDISSLDHIQQLLQEANIPFDTNDSPCELIIRRIIQANNRQKIFLNDTSITRNKLEEIGKSLVNIHGQHDNQALLQLSSHIHFLDGFGQLTDLCREVKVLYHTYQQTRKEYEKFKQQSAESFQLIEKLSFEQKEIEDLQLQPGEESTLRQEANVLNHAEKLSFVFAKTLDELNEKEGSLIERLGALQQILAEVEQVDPHCTQFLNTLESCLYQLEDLHRDVSSYANKFQENPERLEWINQRLSQIQSIHRKYNAATPKILKYLAQITKELEQLQNPAENEEKLLERVNIAKQALHQKSKQLSKQRHHAAKKLNQQVVSELQQLGMEKAAFETQLSMKEPKDNEESFHYSPLGIDHVEFLLSVNPGQELRSLVKVASGGELSRIMLALKTILTAVDPVRTMIFDEIDNGISGRVAETVGYKLCTLGQDQQTLCVTHLPQIVAFSDHHFAITKSIQENATYTSIHSLHHEEKVQEIARLMGGSEITSKTINLASEMLERATQKTNS